MMFISFGLYGLLLWDVTTKEVKTIPEPDLSGKMTRNTRSHSGMGIDPVSGDYKVVRILMTYPILHSIDCIPDTKAELYSFKTGHLKQIPYPHQFQFCGDPVCSVHVNGSYYWALSKEPGYILSFDFATEKFDSRLIPIPKTRGIVVDHFPNFHLVEFQGSLALVYNKWADNNLAAAVKESCPDFEIWVWNDESWSLVSAFSIPVPNPCFMGFLENDKLFIKHNDNKLLLFDLATRQLHDLGPWDPLLEQKIFPLVPGFLSTP
ncbi:F-box family protein [Striga asiatica]|uniref:F-box family protein n=1 Tax=Striga asiatica TaxID=4170 RepID=A0A5A7PFL0_STRAF|nr:F-box family protein [Striga asiatica]